MSVVINGTSGITLPDGNEIDGGFTAKAWVNFNQQVPSINASENVSSVTDNAAGNHTVNFSSAFSAATYAVSGAGKYDNSNANADCPSFGPYRVSGSIATGSCKIATAYGGSTGIDCINACSTYHGDLA